MAAIEAGTSAGFEWFLSADEAWRAQHAWLAKNPVEHFGTKVEEVELNATNKACIMRLLALYASHPDNG